MTEKNNINLRFGIIAGIVILAAASRFLMLGIPNVSPIGAMGLFGAAYFTKKYWAFIIPFAALWLTNVLLDNIVYAQYYDSFQWLSNPWVYLGFGAIVLLGMGILQKVSAGRVVVASLLASSLFFLITNFGTWMGGMVGYPMTFSGLMACYAAGIPIFWNTLAGDLLFTGVLFGSFALLQYRFPRLAFS